MIKIRRDEFEGRPHLLRQQRFVLHLRGLMVGLIITWFVVLIGFIAWDTWIAEKQRRLLVACTTPGGHCYERAQDNTAAAIEEILKEGLLQEIATRRVVILAAQCANRSDVQTVADVEKCVERGLKEAKGGTGNNTTG